MIRELQKNFSFLIFLTRLLRGNPYNMSQEKLPSYTPFSKDRHLVSENYVLLYNNMIVMDNRLSENSSMIIYSHEITCTNISVIFSGISARSNVYYYGSFVIW